MAQMQRWNRTMLRVRPRSGQLGITRQGVCTVSRSSLMLKKRICSLPTHAGSQATSTWVIQRFFSSL